AHRAAQATCLRRGSEHGKAPPPPERGFGRKSRPGDRRRHRARGPDSCLQRHAARPQRRSADADPDTARGRRALARRRSLRRDHRLATQYKHVTSPTATTQMNATAPPARLKTRYLDEIRPTLIAQFGYSSIMQAPKIEKITLNMGVGMAKQDSKVLKAA